MAFLSDLSQASLVCRGALWEFSVRAVIAWAGVHIQTGSFGDFFEVTKPALRRRVGRLAECPLSS